LLDRPDSSLIRQSHDPKMLHLLNLAGFGMAVWDRSLRDPNEPLVYRTTTIPLFDPNLRSVSRKLSASCVLAHVRGVAYHPRVAISEQNLHPFKFDGVPLAMAHNGDLHRFSEIELALAEHVKPALRAQVRGTTDSEWVYALLLSQFDDPSANHDGPAICRAVERTLRIIRRERERAGISTSSSLNLFLADGDTVVAVRFTFDFGCYDTTDPSSVHEASLRYLSLWYSLGRSYGFHDGEWKMVGGARRADTAIVASEPLTNDTTSWLEVPEYSMIFIERSGGTPQCAQVMLDV
jgi:glutamine amidotransferase